MAKIGKPVDRGEWQMSPPTVNAYYDAQLNEMVFPAGILQPPFYANASPMPTNFGGIGMVMGHELTHGFDDEGRQFDAEGNLKDWWGPAVNTEFERRAACVKNQFDGYVVLGDVHVNGKLTLGENIADLGGVKLAYRAMHGREREGRADAAPRRRVHARAGVLPRLRAGLVRQDRATRRSATRSRRTRTRRRTSASTARSPTCPSSPQAFQCKPDAKMVRKERCEVW